MFIKVKTAHFDVSDEGHEIFINLDNIKEYCIRPESWYKEYAGLVYINNHTLDLESTERFLKAVESMSYEPRENEELLRLRKIEKLVHEFITLPRTDEQFYDRLFEISLHLKKD